MKLILNLKRVLLSYKFILFLLFILACGAGVATFLESIYDTQTAKIFVYNAFWYEVLMFVLMISLIGIILQTKMYKRFGAFVIHLAFIVIIIGAFLTRYFGDEGIMHIKEGDKQNQMVSVKSYLQIKSDNQIFEYPLNLARIGNNDFSFSQEINSKTITIKFNSYEPAQKGQRATLMVDAIINRQISQTIAIKGGVGWLGEPSILNFDNQKIELSWGSKLINLPFWIKLNDFELLRYPGSKSPSSYASYIDVLDTNLNKILDYKIFMNHPLSFEGYKFFQSSYDPDESGSVLEVNKDPGKWPTYFGYFLLCLGFVGNFFTKKSRFAKLKEIIKNSSFAFFISFALLSFAAPSLQSSELEQFRANSYEHASGEFATLLVQDYKGRIKPIGTEAHEIVNKISGKSSLIGLSAEQIILGINTNPSLWRTLEIIKLNNNEIKELLNLPKEQNFVSFNQAFDENGNYKLAIFVDKANEKSVSQRGVLDNELIKFDERLNIAYLTFKGVYFKFIPIANDKSNKWLSPNDAFYDDRVDSEVKNMLNDYLVGLEIGLQGGDWSGANKALNELKAYQKAVSSHILPSLKRTQIEILYNKLSIFKNLVYFYLIIGVIALFLGFISIFLLKRFSNLEKLIFAIFVAGFLAHTLGLGLRWYISGHAPWSDSYESMIYIGWSAILAGMILFKRSILILAASSLLAAIMMLVAHMSFINPQITNLVPVLKSYWLSVHVSVITASYGFLGLGALLGLIVLILMILKNDKNKDRLNAQIKYLIAIDEISLIIGLSMLTVGNFFGGIWANESWGRYWGWDPKETWSFVSIIVYAIVLHLRFIPKLNSVYVFAITSVFAYSSIIMTYFGVNFYLTGMHSYAATGQSPEVPNLVYYVLFTIILISIFASKGKDIKPIK
ncbi:cytochrome c biogenesis protein [Campylobacter iguaniorum]|nr:cytochrome c biogenesis protein [Campylobacter iguaniorum]